MQQSILEVGVLDLDMVGKLEDALKSARGASGPPADRDDIGAGKDARGPAAEGEGVPERGRQAAGDRRAGTFRRAARRLPP